MWRPYRFRLGIAGLLMLAAMLAGPAAAREVAAPSQAELVHGLIPSVVNIAARTATADAPIQAPDTKANGNAAPTRRAGCDWRAGDRCGARYRSCQPGCSGRRPGGTSGTQPSAQPGDLWREIDSARNQRRRFGLFRVLSQTPPVAIAQFSGPNWIALRIAAE